MSLDQRSIQFGAVAESVMDRQFTCKDQLEKARGTGEDGIPDSGAPEDMYLFFMDIYFHFFLFLKHGP